MPFQSSNDFRLSEFIQNTLREDIGPGDLTTNLVVPANSRSLGLIKVKEDAFISGMEVFFAFFRELDPDASFTAYANDKDFLKKGSDIGRIESNTRSLLSGERTALNILQRMCGIASLTARYVEKTAGTKAKILDTRKTPPGLRTLDKYAVTCGGGNNHRFGLFDGILIKDNHIKAAGSIKNAVDKVRQEAPHLSSIEVETASMEQIDEALAAGVDVIMLDNMSVDETRIGVKRIEGRAKVEISGGINLDNVRDYALAGSDFISVGALTHSAPAVDISLNIFHHVQK